MGRSRCVYSIILHPSPYKPPHTGVPFIRLALKKICWPCKFFGGITVGVTPDQNLRNLFARVNNGRRGTFSFNYIDTANILTYSSHENFCSYYYSFYIRNNLADKYSCIHTQELQNFLFFDVKIYFTYFTKKKFKRSFFVGN